MAGEWPRAARHVLALTVFALTVLALTVLTSTAVAALGADSARAATAACGVSQTTLAYQVPWWQTTLGLRQVWPITKGAGVEVAVIDTGVDAQQRFLKGAVLPGIDIVNGTGTATTDCDGHGTFVAGLIAGRQLPDFHFSGVAPAAMILPIRQANTPVDGTASHLAQAIVAAVRAGARVINVSVVTPDPTPDLTAAVNFALAKDVVIVAAAGNDSTQGPVQYPAGYSGVLAVGAVAANGQQARFSQTGVGVVAPGVDLLGPGANGPGLVSGSGTSYATPLVAGVAALIRSYYPRLTAAQVIRRIETTADHPAGRLPDPGLGWGEIDPYAAVTAILPGESGPVRSASQASVVVTIPRPAASPRDGIPITAAVLGSVLAIVILLSGGVIRRGRARGWAPPAAARSGPGGAPGSG